AGTPGRAPEICALVFALGLGSGCGGDSDAPVPPDPLGVTPAGRLVQQTLRGPILHTTAQGWRTIIQGGTVTVRPPEGEADPLTQYVSQGMREHLGTLDIRAWAGDRRSIMLPGGAKITLHGQGGQLIRLSIYDGTESHEVDVLTQTVMRSQATAPLQSAATMRSTTARPRIWRSSPPGRATSASACRISFWSICTSRTRARTASH